jgi:hypothetical protein
MKKAYRKRYEFGDSEKYRLFLKKNLLRLNPRYYSVASYRSFETPDGLMYAVQIIAEIEDPTIEPIAECWINDQYIYLWREQCWTIASDEKGRLILREGNQHSFSGLQTGLGSTVKNSQYKIDIAPPPCNKVMVIHPIGTETVE